MARFLYNILFPLVFLAMLPRFIYRMARRGGYRAHFGQRLGRYESALAERLRQRRGEWVWVRAVSVGEMQIAEKLIRQLRKLEPDLPIVLSTTTSTGYALGQTRFAEALGDWLELIYTPLDFLPVVGAALEHIQPRRILYVEAEVWPNLVALAKRRGVRQYLVNARLSPRSERRYRKFRALAGPIFASLDRICVAESEDLAVWHSLGVPRERIIQTGSIKFDHSTARTSPEKRAEMEAVLAELGWPAAGGEPTGRLVLMAGSTHPGEEELLARIYLKLRPAYPQLRLLLAPRHFERTPEIEREMGALGIPVRRRSRIQLPELALVSGSAQPMPGEAAVSAHPPHGDPHPPALILDTTGELRHWYSVGDVVVIGKSLRSSGGQNPVEVLAAGAALVMGPRMENFRVVVRSLREHRAAVQVADDAALEAAIAHLLENPQERREMAERGHAIVGEHHGATLRSARVTLDLTPIPA